jgi:hypothetical protein
MLYVELNWCVPLHDCCAGCDILFSLVAARTLYANGTRSRTAAGFRCGWFKPTTRRRTARSRLRTVAFCTSLICLISAFQRPPHTISIAATASSPMPPTLRQNAALLAPSQLPAKDGWAVTHRPCMENVDSGTNIHSLFPIGYTSGS